MISCGQFFEKGLKGSVLKEVARRIELAETPDAATERRSYRAVGRGLGEVCPQKAACVKIGSHKIWFLRNEPDWIWVILLRIIFEQSRLWIWEAKFQSGSFGKTNRILDHNLGV